MTKSRPNHLIKEIYKPEVWRRVTRALTEERGGVRDAGATHRWIANRTFEPWHWTSRETYEVTVKIASDADGEVYDVSAGFDDVLAVAREAGLAVRDGFGGPNGWLTWERTHNRLET